MKPDQKLNLWDSNLYCVYSPTSENMQEVFLMGYHFEKHYPEHNGEEVKKLRLKYLWPSYEHHLHKLRSNLTISEAEHIQLNDNQWKILRGQSSATWAWFYIQVFGS